MTDGTIQERGTSRRIGISQSKEENFGTIRVASAGGEGRVAHHAGLQLEALVHEIPAGMSQRTDVLSM